MVALFDALNRTRLGPARRNESDFPYVNESARPELGPIRDQFDEWFARPAWIFSPVSL